MMRLAHVFCIFLYVGVSVSSDPKFINGVFPKNFMWGVASASYQIEGAWNVAGKGLSIWDTYCHSQTNNVIDKSSGDVACDSYHHWKEDIQLIKNMNMGHYRFSISWPRLIPTGVGAINQEAVNFYRNIITNLTKNGITPMVTLYHWDLPQALQNMGGWLNDSSSDWFQAYAIECFTLFGDQVKYWISINEPYDVAWLGYGNGQFAPSVSGCPGTCPYIAGHNLIKAHAKAYRAYERAFKPSQNGQFGISLNCYWKEPGSEKFADVQAAERAMQFQLGWFANPIFATGDYPILMKNIIANRSLEQGVTTSRLPTFSATEKQYINGSADFFGFNTYSSQLAFDLTDSKILNQISYVSDAAVFLNKSSSWPGCSAPWLKFTPWGTRNLLKWISSRYNNPPVIITENGWADGNGSTDDPWRTHFYQYYINAVLQAHILDGCNIKGYTAWALLDDFEWTSGYTQKFGLHYVNFSDPSRARTPKASSHFYANIAKQNGFPSNRSSYLVANKMLWLMFVCLGSWKTSAFRVNL